MRVFDLESSGEWGMQAPIERMVASDTAFPRRPHPGALKQSTAPSPRPWDQHLAIRDFYLLCVLTPAAGTS